jgi:protoporphyrinogen oxidase
MEPDPARQGMEYFFLQSGQLLKSNTMNQINFASQELISLGLAQARDIINGAVVRLPKAYPVYGDHYTERRAIIRDGLVTNYPGLQVVGGNSMHQCNNQTHSMMTAMLTARNILTRKDPYIVWQINQDAKQIEAGSAGTL